MNYFDFRGAAKRYKEGRPDFHIIISEIIREKIGFEGKLNHCLDVACGTGLLSKALLFISKNVTGIDQSQEMLDLAEKDASIEYLLGDAESLNVYNGFTDLITVSSAYHWFDQKAFLKSCAQRLKKDSFLVIHNNYFTAKTAEEDFKKFTEWMVNDYLKKYKSPDRNIKKATLSDWNEIGFEFHIREDFQNYVRFTKEELIRFLITQSNITSAVEVEGQNLEEVIAYLESSLEEHFEKYDSRNFIFGNRIIFLKRM